MSPSVVHWYPKYKLRQVGVPSPTLTRGLHTGQTPAVNRPGSTNLWGHVGDLGSASFTSPHYTTLHTITNTCLKSNFVWMSIEV